jgi:DNA-binding PadR family transcriptional regulator
MSTRLSDTSYAVLGLLERFGPATPYQLKQIAQVSILHFWTIPHTQIYSECARLAQDGLLEERREETGRRRRTYQLTSLGHTELKRWREDPVADFYELRDPGLLKLFCGGDPATLAPTQLERHQKRLELYLKLQETQMPEGMRLALEAGIGHWREYVRFWSHLTATAQQDDETRA